MAINSEKAVKSYLAEFGLNDKEVIIYMTLLKSGPSTIMDLSRKTGIKRSTTHNNVEELIKKGLVSQTNYGERRMAVAEDPEKLKFLLEQRKWEVQKLEKVMPDIVKGIYETIPQAKENSEIGVKYYDGKTGVKIIYTEALKAKEIRSFANIEKVVTVLPENGDLFLEAQRKNKELSIKEILTDNDITKDLVSQFTKSPKYYYKFSKVDLGIDAIDVLIFDDKVSVIDVSSNTGITGMVIHNKSYFHIMSSIFDYIWNTLPANGHSK